MNFRTFEELFQFHAAPGRRKRVAVANPDIHTLEAVKMAVEAGLVQPILTGGKDGIQKSLSAVCGGGPALEAEIFDAPDAAAACSLAVELVRSGRADFLMKGGVDTSVFLKAVVHKERGLGLGRLMSHIAMFEVPGMNRLLTVVDGGMVPYPGLNEKKCIIENTVTALRRMGYQCPKVGILTCVEKVNAKMEETVEADQLKHMNEGGEISGCVVEGPISYDCAVSKEISRIKGFDSPVAGEADVLVVQNIHMGNAMGKMLTCTCNARMAGFVAGAACPVVLSSRGASAEEKYLSILAAAAASGSEGGMLWTIT